MKNFRSFTKVTNRPKVVIPTYEKMVREFNYSNGNKMVVTFYPYYHGNSNTVKIEVYNNNGERKFIHCISTYKNPTLADVAKEGYEFLENVKVAGYMKSIEENICSLDFDNLRTDIEDYGWANGWNEGDSHPRIEKYLEDRKNNPYLVAYETEYSRGTCCTTTVNWTYGFKYTVDSSD